MRISDIYGEGEGLFNLLDLAQEQQPPPAEEYRGQEEEGMPRPDLIPPAPVPAPAPTPPSAPVARPTASESLPLTVTRDGKPVSGIVLIVPAIGDEMVGFTDAEGKIALPIPQGVSSGTGIPIVLVDEHGQRIEANVIVGKPGEPKTVEVPALPVAAPKKEPVAAAKVSMVAPIVLGVVLAGIFAGNYFYKKY